MDFDGLKTSCRIFFYKTYYIHVVYTLFLEIDIVLYFGRGPMADFQMTFPSVKTCHSRIDLRGSQFFSVHPI